jgi:Cu-Zn family superoxide dismutase
MLRLKPTNSSPVTILGIVLAYSLISLEAASSRATSATAQIKNTEGQIIGHANLADGSKGLIVKLRLDNAPVGTRALHIHEIGRCAGPTFESAGGHLNPLKATHGMLSEKGPHTGDLPNVSIPANGSLELELYVPGAQLDGEDSLLDADGAAVVLHAKPDDHRTDPAGNAGDRIACGVIQ